MRFEHTGIDLAPGWLHRQCTAEWVLTLAGDEVPSAALVAALPELCADREIRQYWLPVRWVWPDPEHWLDELPWAPDFHNRLLRNDDHLWFEGARTRAPGRCCRRAVEAPVYHLDGVLLSEAERAEKAHRYAALRPGLTAPGGGELNERYYLPERHARLPLAGGAAGGSRAPGRGGRRAARRPLRAAAQAPVAVGRRADFEAHRGSAALSDGDYRASIRLLERDHRMLAGETRNVYAACATSGRRRGPGVTACRPRSGCPTTGATARARCSSTTAAAPVPAAVGPGEECIVPVTVSAPGEGGRYELGLDVVHERVRWFECETRVVMDVHTAARARAGGRAGAAGGGP